VDRFRRHDGWAIEGDLQKKELRRRSAEERGEKEILGP
jgi:hypothetical protein